MNMKIHIQLSLNNYKNKENMYQKRISRFKKFIR